MVDYVSPRNTPDTLQQPLSRDMLQERFAEFFMQLFPVAYHHTVNPSQQDFTDKFKDCLYKTMDDIQPFGDIPKQISRSVAKSLEATRVLVQALTLGKTVLDKTDSVLFSGASHHQSNCYRALLRMTHCPKCKGISSSVKTCKGFCTNVVRWGFENIYFLLDVLFLLEFLAYAWVSISVFSSSSGFTSSFSSSFSSTSTFTSTSSFTSTSTFTFISILLAFLFSFCFLLLQILFHLLLLLLFLIWFLILMLMMLMFLLHLLYLMLLLLLYQLLFLIFLNSIIDYFYL